MLHDHALLLPLQHLTHFPVTPLRLLRDNLYRIRVDLLLSEEHFKLAVEVGDAHQGLPVF